MDRLLFLITFSILLYIPRTFTQGCPTGGLYLETQTDIDNFHTLYPTCTSFNHRFLIIQGSGIDNLLGLAQLTEVNVPLTIRNTSITNLQGLHNVTQGDNIRLEDNPSLSSITALINIQNLNTFSVTGCHQLTSLHGLENISTLDNLGIGYCDQLVDITALSNLIHLSSLNISNNSLTDLQGLHNLQSIDQSLTIRSNSITDLSAMIDIRTIGNNLFLAELPITDLSGFNNLETIGGGFGLQECHNLVNLSGFHKLNAVGNYFNIARNSNLNSLNGFPQIETLRNVSIQYNPNLANLSALSSLTEVTFSLTLNENIQLSHLDDLSNLVSIGGNLIVNRCYNLIDIDGLNQLAQVNGTLRMINNFNLNACAIESICMLLTEGSTSIDIRQNGDGCRTVAEVESECSPDETPPSMRCQDITITFNDDGHVLITPDDVDDGSSDDSGLELFVDKEYFSCFLGTYEVMLTGIDPSGNSDFCIATITVVGDDEDCDRVHNACDQCPGGNDAIDHNQDGIPDCWQRLDVNELDPAWTCENGQNTKVYICHKGKTLCVDDHAQAAHLDHGDYLGTCTSCMQGFQQPVTTISKAEAWPNPFNNKVSLAFNVQAAGIVSIIIRDIQGRTIYEANENKLNGIYEIDINDNHFNGSGTYYYQVIMPSETLTGKLIKL